MTEAERTALIHQINRHAHLSSHQMEAVMGALHYLKWEPPETGMNKNSELISSAPLPNYNAPTPARCEPPEGTESGTFHILGSRYNRAVFLWSDNRWFGTADDNPNHPTNMARLGYRYSHPVQMEPPVLDPHAALRDAVVEAAIEARAEWFKAEATFGDEEHAHRQVYWKYRDAIFAGIAALTAAQTPPDPAKELRRAMAAVTIVGPSEAAAHLEIAIDRAIAALQGDGT